MKTTLQIAHANIPYPEKGDDAHLVRLINGTDSAWLLAVADGLTLNAGKAAALWVINWLDKVEEVENPRKIYQALRRTLAEERGVHNESETTLTCGILREVYVGDETFLRFDYFAIGDSPIWKVVESKKSSRYPFQRVIIHGPPYPAETAQVYATVRLHRGDVDGMVTFGSVEIGPDEVLVVCTDGIPEREVFIRDIGKSEDTDGAPTSLCHWLFQRSPYLSEDLRAVLANYNRRGVLYDDTTIIVARLGRATTTDDNAHSSWPAEVHASAITSQLDVSADRSCDSSSGGPPADPVHSGGVTEPRERMAADEHTVAEPAADWSIEVSTAPEGQTEPADNPNEDTMYANEVVAAPAPEEMAPSASPACDTDMDVMSEAKTEEIASEGTTPESYCETATGDASVEETEKSIGATSPRPTAPKD